MDDDAIAEIGKPAVAVAQIIGRQARAAIEAEQDFLPRTKAVSDNLIAVHRNPDNLIRLAFE